MASRVPFLVVAIVSAAIGVYLAIDSRQEDRLAQANADVLAGHEPQAVARLSRVSGAPRGRADALLGYAYLGSGRLAQARAAFRGAVIRDPNNWVLRRDYAIVLLGLGQRVSADTMMRAARSLNPLMPLPPGFVTSG